MGAAPKYQVFVSSTFEDLRSERDQVIKAVLEMGHIPVGMEMFSAADEEQWKIIARHIDESDYYAVIVAHRLGSLTPDGVSYTRKEYEYARSKGIPCLGFVIDDSANWPVDRVDKDPADVDALNDFKSRIREKPIQFWTSADDLHGKFSISLMKTFVSQPGDGWVRASTVSGGAAAAAEIVRLSSENGTLRDQLREAESAVAAERSDDVARTLDILSKSTRELSYRYSRHGEWQHDATPRLIQIFRVMGPEMMVESSVSVLAGILAMAFRADFEQPWDIVAHNQVRSVLADLFTLDLVVPSTRKHPVSDQNEYWALSTFGVDILKEVRKVALAAPRPAEEPEESGLEATPDSLVSEARGLDSPATSDSE